jgi:hypothetical protein
VRRVAHGIAISPVVIVNVNALTFGQVSSLRRVRRVNRRRLTGGGRHATQAMSSPLHENALFYTEGGLAI